MMLAMMAAVYPSALARMEPCSYGGRVASLGMTKLHRDVRQKNPTGKSAKTCPDRRAKIFRLTRRANQRYQLARLTRQEGRAHVTNARWDAADAKAATDERSSTRTAKSCGPGAPVL